MNQFSVENLGSPKDLGEDNNNIDNNNSSPSDLMENDETQILQGVSLKANLPNVNVPEKIILCIDVCIADQSAVYRLADGTTYSPLNMVKKILEFFVHLKLAINRRTQFAFMLLKNNDVILLSSFSSDAIDVINRINLIGAVHCTTATFDFTKVFDALTHAITIPEFNEQTVLPPPYVVRMIVLYGRSKCLPQIPMSDHYSSIKNQSYLFIDILLMHDEDCNENDCEKIYDALQNLDTGYSYVFEVSRNATKAHDCMAKLLAHPLQRPLQKHTKYTFDGYSDEPQSIYE